MKMHLAIGALVIAGFLGTGCVAGKVRYWKATDMQTRRTFYTVDTDTAPLLAGSPVFLSTEGKVVGLSSYELEAMTENDWKKETGADVVTETEYSYGRGYFIRARPVLPPPKAVESKEPPEDGQ